MNALLPLRYVAVGGAAGAALRWAVLSATDESAATFVVLGLNAVGSLLLGLLLGAKRKRGRSARVTENQFLLAGTGFCGSLTTFSTFALDVATALDGGDPGRAAWVAAATATATVIPCGIGYRLGWRR